MGRPLIFFLSGVTVLLLAQALWLSQTGGALGQDVENRPPVAATR